MLIGADWISHANQKGVTHALVVELVLGGVVILHGDTCHYLHVSTHAGVVSSQHA